MIARSEIAGVGAGGGAVNESGREVSRYAVPSIGWYHFAFPPAMHENTGFSAIVFGYMNINNTLCC